MVINCDLPILSIEEISEKVFSFLNGYTSLCGMQMKVSYSVSFYV